MAATKASIGYLGTFNMGSPLVPVIEVKRITPNLISVPPIDCTHLLSPNATEEMIPGLIKPGQIEIMGNFVGDASQLAFLTNAQARTVFGFTFTGKVNAGTQTSTYTGTGFVADYAQGAIEPSKVREFTLKIQMTSSFTEVVA